MKLYRIYTIEFQGNIRYIGYTSQKLVQRKANHLRNLTEAENGKRKWNKRLSWIKSVNKQIEIKEIDMCNDAYQAKQLEIYWISQFKTWGFDLVNMTEGGDGGNTWSQRSKEEQDKTRRKISEANKGNIRSEKTIQKWREKVMQNEVWRKTGYTKGYKYSKEFGEKISKAKKGIPISEETRQKRLGKEPANKDTSKFKGVIQINKSTLRTINFHDTIGIALRSIGKSHTQMSKIKECCEGDRKSAFGFIWKWQQ